MNRLKDKVAIITGAADGMGKAEALLFAEQGAKVLATDIQIDKLKDWVTNVQAGGLNIDYALHDVRLRENWEEIAEYAVRKFGGIDILVNNAGIYPPGATTENTTDILWDKVIATNLTSAFIGAQVCLPHLRKSGKGSIIHISSIAGLVGGNGAAYSASKGGLRMLAKDQAVEFAPYNIRVNSIHPGGVLTPMTDFIVATDAGKEMLKALCPMGRIGNSIEVANATLFLASDEASYITGAELVVDGGLVAR